MLFHSLVSGRALSAEMEISVSVKKVGNIQVIPEALKQLPFQPPSLKRDQKLPVTDCSETECTVSILFKKAVKCYLKRGNNSMIQNILIQNCTVHNSCLMYTLE